MSKARGKSTRGVRAGGRGQPAMEQALKLQLRISAGLNDRLRDALAEDVGPGDVTTECTVPPGARGRGELIAKAEGIFCGAPVADRIWRIAGTGVKVDWHLAEGERVTPGVRIADLKGPFATLLIGERVALNFLQHLSGVATLTRRLVDAATEAAAEAGHRPPDLCDTRKTTPLWRELERYAVRAGGGVNHRFGLFDMVLIKENHARAAGGVGEAVRLARSRGRIARSTEPEAREAREAARAGGRGQTPSGRIKIAAEARDIGEVREAIDAGAELVLLDNMKPAQIRRVVENFGGRGAQLEVSGGINLRNIGSYAKTGVDRISVGAVTHSAPALDMSLQLFLNV